MVCPGRRRQQSARSETLTVPAKEVSGQSVIGRLTQRESASLTRQSSETQAITVVLVRGGFFSSYPSASVCCSWTWSCPTLVDTSTSD